MPELLRLLEAVAIRLRRRQLVDEEFLGVIAQSCTTSLSIQ
jgi:hypothetical protein